LQSASIPATPRETVRSTLDCGGLTPPWPSFCFRTAVVNAIAFVACVSAFEGGVEPPQSKVLRTELSNAGRRNQRTATWQ
jgi:hypothetical protein